jgi:hypothetical protein
MSDIPVVTAPVLRRMNFLGDMSVLSDLQRLGINARKCR